MKSRESLDFCVFPDDVKVMICGLGRFEDRVFLDVFDYFTGSLGVLAYRKEFVRDGVKGMSLGLSGLYVVDENVLLRLKWDLMGGGSGEDLMKKSSLDVCYSGLKGVACFEPLGVCFDLKGNDFGKSEYLGEVCGEVLKVLNSYVSL